MRFFLTFIFLLFFLILTGTRLAAAGQIEVTPEPVPAEETPPPPVEAMPTIDRLAAPPTVYPPTQADDGEQLFWLYCQPCHGDKGQGLTDEWREQYPEEHQYCWGRGCHAETPYVEGFTLPKVVPAVIGEGTLSGYATMGQVFTYMRVTMPLEYPGKLADEEYLAISAFLARAHGAWDGSPLTIDNVAQIRLRPVPQPGDDVQTIQAEGDVFSGTPVPSEDKMGSGEQPQAVDETIAWIGIALALLLFGGGWIWLRLK